MRVEFYWIAVAIVTIVSAARFTRLVVVDKFPPVVWLREKYEDWTQDNPWWWLVNCGYCLAPYFVLLIGAWGWFAGVYDPYHCAGLSQRIWWIFNGFFAAAYAASIVMAYDGADAEDD